MVLFSLSALGIRSQEHTQNFSMKVMTESCFLLKMAFHLFFLNKKIIINFLRLEWYIFHTHISQWSGSRTLGLCSVFVWLFFYIIISIIICIGLRGSCFSPFLFPLTLDVLLSYDFYGVIWSHG